MSDIPSSIFVRQDLVPERPAPVKTTGFVGFLRTRLFNSPTNILITIASALPDRGKSAPSKRAKVIFSVVVQTGSTMIG